MYIPRGRQKKREEILVDIGRNRVYIDNTILHEKEYRILE